LAAARLANRFPLIAVNPSLIVRAALIAAPVLILILLPTVATPILIPVLLTALLDFSLLFGAALLVLPRVRPNLILLLLFGAALFSITILFVALLSSIAAALFDFVAALFVLIVSRRISAFLTL
jgi:hypothetical protein